MQQHFRCWGEFGRSAGRVVCHIKAVLRERLMVMKNLNEWILSGLRVNNGRPGFETSVISAREDCVVEEDLSILELHFLGGIFSLF